MTCTERKVVKEDGLFIPDHPEQNSNVTESLRPHGVTEIGGGRRWCRVTTGGVRVVNRHQISVEIINFKGQYDSMSYVHCSVYILFTY